MAKESKQEQTCTSYEDACEIIELAINEQELLTRAFSVITEAISLEGNDDFASYEEDIPLPNYLLQ